jgi:hypothetical protein
MLSFELVETRSCFDLRSSRRGFTRRLLYSASLKGEMVSS